MSGTNAPDRATLHAALEVACRAPSLHNSQPWRWQLAEHSVHLMCDTDRLLRATDPSGRQLVISCGAALQHARVAFAALGWHTVVRRLPDPARQEHLASIEFEQLDHVRARDVALATAATRRRSDRRPFLPGPVSEAVTDQLVGAARTAGADLLVLPAGATANLLAASRLPNVEHGAEDGYRVELAEWSGRTAALDGVPTRALPDAAALDRVPTARDFHVPGGALTAPAPSTDGATISLLCTRTDDRRAWLRAGEALGAVLLEATAVWLASCTLTHLTEIAETRTHLEGAARSAGARPGAIQAMLRIGRAPAPFPGPRSPRRPLRDVLEPLPSAREPLDLGRNR